MKHPLLAVALLALLATFAACDSCTSPGVGPDGGVVIRADCAPDTDGDGICDEQEVELGLAPNNPDTDGDGIGDADEVNQGTDPDDQDTDGDGLNDGDEDDVGRDPTTPDGACVGTTAQAEVGVPAPVDIIIAIDSSGSMSGESRACPRPPPSSARPRTSRPR